ncbi:methylenetetrahydrofolate reductase [Fructobacillus fructosus]|uniref:methylenetetrahydrofolate reductase n=2 Tax=Fructobacillus fructosus TaxID=1631 RepID=UPI002DB02D88|nr:5 [Fructobacillus fructosus] [Fructobacillus fructosus]CAK1250218.1 5 [Fructobacillus fructosus] [Fructobacillus fructosus]CAK1250641.1 5 [Fructobacillus fructosus] [Fructobacillus fructosus]
MCGKMIRELYQKGYRRVLSAELTKQEAEKLLQSGLTKREEGFAFFSLVNQGQTEDDFTSLLALAGRLQRAIDRPIMVHLRTGDLSPQMLPEFFEQIAEAELVNFLIIGGDKRVHSGGFSTTEDLLKALRKGTPDCLSLGATIDPSQPAAPLKAKVRQAAGADFLISQVLFDEQPLLALQDKLRKANPTFSIPLIPGLLLKPTLGQLRWVNHVLKVAIPDAFYAQPALAGQRLRAQLNQANFVGEHFFTVPEK